MNIHVVCSACRIRTRAEARGRSDLFAAVPTERRRFLPTPPLVLNRFHGRKVGMNKYSIGIGLAIAVFFISAFTVFAQDDGRVRFRASLDGYQEVAAPVASISTTGRGRFRAELVTDGIERVIRYELTYDALETGTATVAHIHLGIAAINGGVSAFLCGNAATPVCPPTGGTVTGTIRVADVVGPAGQGIAAGEFD